MPARGKHGGEYWTRDHIDTADTLKYIHIQTQAGITPDADDFLKTAIGKQLAKKWGDGTKGAKKVKYNFAGTLARYKEWRDTGAGSGLLILFWLSCLLFQSKAHTILLFLVGDFTSEQLSRAGLPIPEGNAERQGGLNTNPGSDSETEELKQRAKENADIFGGEGGTSTGAGDAGYSEPDQFFTPRAEEVSPPSEKSFTTVDMTHTVRLHVVPGFDVESATKTMFLITLELPGGLVEANPVLCEDLMGVKITFVELGQALDAAFLLEDVAVFKAKATLSATYGRIWKRRW